MKLFLREAERIKAADAAQRLHHLSLAISGAFGGSDAVQREIKRLDAI